MNLQKIEIDIVKECLKKSAEELEVLKHLKLELLTRSRDMNSPEVTRLNLQVYAQEIERFLESVNNLHKRIKGTLGIYEKEEKVEN